MSDPFQLLAKGASFNKKRYQDEVAVFEVGTVALEPSQSAHPRTPVLQRTP